MKMALFYYDEFAEFEIVLVALIFPRQHEIIAIALENREYKSEEGQRFCIDQVIQDVDVDLIDLLVIPGGNPAPLAANRELKEFIEKLVARNKKVAGICGGAELLAGLGLLKGKRCTGGASGETPGTDEYQYFAESILSNEYVVVDGNFITAQGQAYVEFAVELARQMGLVTSEEAYADRLRYFKNIR